MQLLGLWRGLQHHLILAPNDDKSGGGGGGKGGSGEDSGGDAGGASSGADKGAGSGDGASSDDEKGGSELPKGVTMTTAEHQALMSRLQTAETEAIQRKKLLAKYGATPEEVATMRLTHEQSQQHDRENRGAYEEQLQAERTKTQAAEERASGLDTQWQKELLGRELTSAVATNRPLDAALLTPPGGREPIIVTALRELFEWDGDDRLFRHKTEFGDDSKKLTASAYITREREKSLSTFFESSVQQGAGASGAEGGSRATVVKIWRDDPRRTEKYEAAKTAKANITFVSTPTEATA